MPEPNRANALEPDVVCFTAPDGVSIVADELGDRAAPTAILMHGGGQTRRSWSGAMTGLADRGYHVISYDARGHGESGWSRDGNYGLAARVDDLRAILAATAPPFALVGASMGGATAMHAVASGVRPDALVLVDIVLRPDPRGVRRIVDFMSANPGGFATLDEAAAAVAAYNPNRERPPNATGLGRNLRQATDGRFYWHWDPRILRDAEADSRLLATLVRDSRWGRDLAALLVRGAQSDVVTPDGVAHLRRALPGLEVLEVDGAGHMVAGDRNDPFTHGVIAYLERVMPAR